MDRFLLSMMLLGTATVYGPYDGSPLYCDRGGEPGSLGPMIYGRYEGPWVAIDVGLYESGWARCGDLLRITGPDGSGGSWELEARALDAGYLMAYQVLDWRGPDGRALPIVVDIPIHLAPFELVWGGFTSAPARVVNVTRALGEELERRAGR